MTDAAMTDADRPDNDRTVSETPLDSTRKMPLSLCSPSPVSSHQVEGWRGEGPAGGMSVQQALGMMEEWIAQLGHEGGMG